MKLRVSHFVLFLLVIIIGVSIYFAINPQELPAEPDSLSKIYLHTFFHLTLFATPSLNHKA
ncbi:MAG: hypothetical protein FWC93_07320 [Defluviitaleaceae bacterium]|nr:hypothetical protein [Defluviitaleaceae bacterium]